MEVAGLLKKVVETDDVAAATKGGEDGDLVWKGSDVILGELGSCDALYCEEVFVWVTFVGVDVYGR